MRRDLAPSTDWQARPRLPRDTPRAVLIRSRGLVQDLRVVVSLVMADNFPQPDSPDGQRSDEGRQNESGEYPSWVTDIPARFDPVTGMREDRTLLISCVRVKLR